MKRTSSSAMPLERALRLAVERQNTVKAAESARAAGSCTCPVCGREVSKAKYLTGYQKCTDCVVRIKEMRNEQDYLVSCLPLFYGRFWVHRAKVSHTEDAR